MGWVIENNKIKPAAFAYVEVVAGGGFVFVESSLECLLYSFVAIAVAVVVAVVAVAFEI